MMPTLSSQVAPEAVFKASPQVMKKLASWKLSNASAKEMK